MNTDGVVVEVQLSDRHNDQAPVLGCHCWLDARCSKVAVLEYGGHDDSSPQVDKREVVLALGTAGLGKSRGRQRMLMIEGGAHS